ncbi:MAG: hypothetical protein R3F62_19870 [Planctomycetota bacterium]
MVGDAGGQAVARGLAVAAENCHVIVASREPQAWPDEVRFTRLELGDELTPRQAGRSALRMDPRRARVRGRAGSSTPTWSSSR